MKTTTLFYNQYSQGGSVERENWELIPDNEIIRKYGSVESLRTATVEIPDDWKIEKNCLGELKLYSDGQEVAIKGDEQHIYMSDGSTPYFKKMWCE